MIKVFKKHIFLRFAWKKLSSNRKDIICRLAPFYHPGGTLPIKLRFMNLPPAIKDVNYPFQQLFSIPEPTLRNN